MAYIYEKGAEANYLHFCEPDMRRGTKRHHMGELTMEDVIADERPAKLTIVLNGLFDVEEVRKNTKASGAAENSEPCSPEVTRTNGQTIITLTTIRAENHTLKPTPHK